MHRKLTRKIREVYNGRKRNVRTAKLRKLQQEIDDEVANTATSSIVSRLSNGEARLESATVSPVQEHQVLPAIASEVSPAVEEPVDSLMKEEVELE